MMRNTLFYGDNLDVMREHIKGMYNEAEEAGFFIAPSGRKIPKLQIRTIKELLEEGKEFDFPQGYSLKSGFGKRLTKDLDQAKLEI